MKQIAILLTDGMSNLNQKFTIPNARAAKGDGIEIFAIGMYTRSSIHLLTVDFIHGDGIEIFAIGMYTKILIRLEIFVIGMYTRFLISIEIVA